MFEIHPGNWPVAVDANDPRDQFHRTALHEAVVASEHHSAVAMLPAPGIIARLQAFIAGRTTRPTESCACPA